MIDLHVRMVVVLIMFHDLVMIESPQELCVEKWDVNGQITAGSVILNEFAKPG